MLADPNVFYSVKGSMSYPYRPGRDDLEEVSGVVKT